MEMFAVAFTNPITPVKEQVSPSRVRDRLGKVSVLYHVARFKFLGNNRIKAVMVKEFVSRFRDKVKTLTSNNIGLFRQSHACFIPAFATPAVYEKGRVEVWRVCVQRFGKSGGWVSFHRQRLSESLVCRHPHHKRTSEHISACQALRKR